MGACISIQSSQVQASEEPYRCSDVGVTASPQTLSYPCMPATLTESPPSSSSSDDGLPCNQLTPSCSILQLASCDAPQSPQSPQSPQPPQHPHSPPPPPPLRPLSSNYPHLLPYCGVSEHEGIEPLPVLDLGAAQIGNHYECALTTNQFMFPDIPIPGRLSERIAEELRCRVIQSSDIHRIRTLLPRKLANTLQKCTCITEGEMGDKTRCCHRVQRRTLDLSASERVRINAICNAFLLKNVVPNVRHSL